MGEINTSNMKTALIAGATGLIGKQLLQLLLQDSYYEKVKAITRKPLDLQHPKLENVVLDFEKLSEADLKSDDVFCCLGTTIRIAKTKEAFRKVDYTYPLEIARATEKLGSTQYFLVSALGADKNSNIFYNKVKVFAQYIFFALLFYWEIEQSNEPGKALLQHFLSFSEF
jgi:uncharacterized protein YbjT (DUF2867 family)